jgi:hypothetical protein
MGRVPVSTDNASGDAPRSNGNGEHGLGEALSQWRIRLAERSEAQASAEPTEAARSGIDKLPASRDTAPQKLDLRPVDPRFKYLTDRSAWETQQKLQAWLKEKQAGRPVADFTVTEYGGGIYRTSDGKLQLPAEQETSETGLRVDITAGRPAGGRAEAYFHAHPITALDETSGQSFSGQDIVTFTHNPELNAFVVQSKNNDGTINQQFALMRTSETPDYFNLSSDQRERIASAYYLRMNNLESRQGKTEGEASRIAASELAKYSGLNLVYYEGKGGILERVEPEDPAAQAFWDAHIKPPSK